MKSQTKPKHQWLRVHIENLEGRTIYRGLVDTGSNVIRFEHGSGFVTREQCELERWVVVPD